MPGVWVLAVADVADLYMRLLVVLAVFLLWPACYHYRFRHGPAAGAGDPGAYVTYRIRAATYLNGFVGTGEVDVGKYCQDPIQTELRVLASDVLLSVVTLLIYTPHTLYITCARDDAMLLNG